jgi:capsid portal protein
MFPFCILPELRVRNIQQLVRIQRYDNMVDLVRVLMNEPGDPFNVSIRTGYKQRSLRVAKINLSINNQKSVGHWILEFVRINCLYDAGLPSTFSHRACDR